VQMELIEPALVRAFERGGINRPIVKGEFNTEGGATGRAHLQGVIVTRMAPLKTYTAAAAKAIFLEMLGWTKRDVPANMLMVCKFCNGVKLHTWQGMVGYCNKEWKRFTFRHVVTMDVTEVDRENGKRLYMRYGRPMKEYITLTPSNMFERLEIFTAVFTSQDAPHDDFVELMVAVMNTDMYTISAQFAIPYQGGGVTLSRVNALLRLNTQKSTLSDVVMRADICKVFIREEPAKAYPQNMAHRGHHRTYPQAAIDAQFNFSRADIHRQADAARIDTRPGFDPATVPSYNCEVDSPMRDQRFYTAQGMLRPPTHAATSASTSGAKSINNPSTMSI
jgi:hypothetical protein